MSMQSNKSIDEYQLITDENNRYIIEGNTILMQNKADGKLVYLPTSAVFGPNEDIQEGTDEETEQLVEEVLEENYISDSVDEVLDQDTTGSGRRMWTYEESKALIASVDIYKENLHHAVKRKYVWQHISHDLVSQKINMPPEVCKKKWLNLVKTYKNSKENKNKTGRGPTRFMFYQEMDEILGTAPHICSPHSLDISTLETDCSSLGSSHPIESNVPHSEQENVPVQEQIIGDEREEERIEIQVQETENNEVEGQEKQSKKKKKTSVMKLREEVGVLIKKVSEKKDLEERKLKLLEKKLTLDERKVIALEKIAGIEASSKEQ